MPFNVKPFNHSPQWYHDHCLAENGGSAAFRAMLTADMKFIGADIDSTISYEERVDSYEETWNAIMRGSKENASPAQLGELLLQELAAGYRPCDDYDKEPFRSITRLMDKHDVSTTELGVFIKWKAKAANVEKARLAKLKKKPKRSRPTVKQNWFLERKKNPNRGEL